MSHPSTHQPPLSQPRPPPGGRDRPSGRWSRPPGGVRRPPCGGWWVLGWLSAATGGLRASTGRRDRAVGRLAGPGMPRGTPAARASGPWAAVVASGCLSHAYGWPRPRAWPAVALAVASAWRTRAWAPRLAPSCHRPGAWAAVACRCGPSTGPAGTGPWPGRWATCCRPVYRGGHGWLAPALRCAGAVGEPPGHAAAGRPGCSAPGLRYAGPVGRAPGRGAVQPQPSGLCGAAGCG